MPITVSTIKSFVLAGSIVVGCVASGDAQPRLRAHTATDAAPVSPGSARQFVRGAQVSMQVRGGTRIITSNGMPGHAIGTFPNRGNPHRVSAQSYRFEMPARPTAGQVRDLPRGASFGVAVNGVPFDPNAAEFWQGDPRSGWTYNALGGAVPLGLDANYAHVQPSGAYHYHGLPVGLMQQLGWSANEASPLIGFAADGFPIYALTAEVDGKVVRMTSSYRLKPGQRPGGAQPGGRYDGAFMQDYAFVAGAGMLDVCNGARITTAEFRQGTYAYILTDTYPVIPRCLKGAVGRGFAKRR
ncbi:YHYH protein [uncultured Tateyamaria sp.]|uniref:YHYH protein n=1 Tax=uncultured Tateyamaria sp. TaxID=455651 RepID=UPI00261B9CB0|nr:YHYH protein [uncultured Tateyamaria sp.]